MQHSRFELEDVLTIIVTPLLHVRHVVGDHDGNEVAQLLLFSCTVQLSVDLKSKPFHVASCCMSI